MAVGALMDTGHLHGRGDVKVDIHVRRVLGRIVRGKEFAAEEASNVLELTRSMHPENPWLLDRPLYRLGQSACVAGTPKCSSCFLRPACAYAAGSV
jgi:endonuclease III